MSEPAGGATSTVARDVDVADEALASRAVTTSLWLFGRRAVANGIRLVVMGILARRLAPSDFGVVAFAQTFLQFAVVGSAAGLGILVICDRRDDWERRANTTFWINALATLVQLGVAALFVPILAAGWLDADVLRIFACLGLVFFFDQLRVVPEGIVQRRLDHKWLVIRDTVVDVLSAFASVGLALADFGVWSVVIPQVALAPVELGLAFAAARWLPSVRGGLFQARDVVRRGAPLALANYLGLFLNDGDTLVVGRLLGLATLGYYNAAWQLSNTINKNLSSILQQVATPVLAASARDVEGLRAAFRRTLRTLAAIVAPVYVTAFALADRVVLLVYGDRWQAVTPLLRLFLVFMLVRGLTSTASNIYNIREKPEVGLKFNLAFVPFYLGAVFAGARWGVVGVAFAVTAVRVVGGVVFFRVSVRHADLTLGDGVRDVATPLLLSVAVAAEAWLVAVSLGGLAVPPAAAIVAGVAVGGVTYLAGLRFFERDLFASGVAVARRLVRPVLVRRRVAHAE